MNKITITAGSVTLPAELNGSPTARQIWDALPIEGCANTWGDEIYAATRFRAVKDGARITLAREDTA